MFKSRCSLPSLSAKESLVLYERFFVRIRIFEIRGFCFGRRLGSFGGFVSRGAGLGYGILRSNGPSFRLNHCPCISLPSSSIIRAK